MSNNSDYEQVCMLCRRSESVAGQMFQLQKDMCVCGDCLRKSLDTIHQMNLDGMLPPMGDLANMFQGGMPPYGYVSPSGAQEVAKEEADGNKNVNPDEKLRNDSDNKEDNEDNNDDEKENEENPDSSNNPRFGNAFFLNLNDFMGGGMGPRQKVKKKKKGEKKEPIIDIHKIPAPHKIKAQLDEFVVGQEQAKKQISVAVYNHYKRVVTNTMDEIEIEKSNILMLGPTGCGKTYLVKTLARLLDVPLAIADATSLTEAGYIGDDIESVISKLLAAADNDVDRAECGIVFIDEIDKLAKKRNTNSRDVSGESVQQGMLKLLEGSEVEVPVGASSKNAMVPMTTVNTRNILFICGGAFPDLEEIIKQRLTKQATIGFNGELRDKYDKDKNILKKVTVEDLKKFGMIPEFIGRLPIICPLEGLTEEMLVSILKEPKNAILKQYQKLLELDEVKLEFSEDALHAIAKKAIERDTGARALRAIIEEFMTDIMYEIPKDENIGAVTITGDYIEGTGGPIVEIRSTERTLESRERAFLEDKSTKNNQE